MYLMEEWQSQGESALKYQFQYFLYVSLDNCKFWRAEGLFNMYSMQHIYHNVDWVSSPHPLL